MVWLTRPGLNLVFAAGLDRGKTVMVNDKQAGFTQPVRRCWIFTCINSMPSSSSSSSSSIIIINAKSRWPQRTLSKCIDFFACIDERQLQVFFLCHRVCCWDVFSVQRCPCIGLMYCCNFFCVTPAVHVFIVFTTTVTSVDSYSCIRSYTTKSSPLCIGSCNYNHQYFPQVTNDDVKPSRWTTSAGSSPFTMDNFSNSTG